MKSQEDIDRARAALCNALKTTGLNPTQQASLAGMLSALLWVSNSRNSAGTLDRLLAGEPIAASKDPGPAIQRLTDLAARFSPEANLCKSEPPNT